ncbi:MAG: hypothetical protein ACRCZB_05970, partial [Bacteroidales bacterium]
MNIFFNKRIVISTALYLLAISFTFGQQYGQTAESFKDPAFSVLWNNADLTNKKLFVEIMYEKNTCFQDAAEFWLYYGTDSTGGRQVKIDSLLNNVNNCKLSADSFILSEPTAGGYRLRFALNNDDTIAANEAKIRVVSRYQTFFSCKGCGAAGSDVVVDSTSIHPDCPYNNVNHDLLACSKRTGGAKNWEGFMVDHRDCKIYRMVAMPHIASYNKGEGRWWHAQNFNYTKNLIMNKDATVNGGIGTYWCPGMASFDGKPRPVKNISSSASGGEVACKHYGALYIGLTLRSRNGLAVVQDPLTGINEYSVAQGICPKGWVVPGRKDFAVMFNKVGGCTDDTKAQTAVAPHSVAEAPCHHLCTGLSPTGTEHFPTAYDSDIPLLLRSTLSSRVTAEQDSGFMTADNPVWPWYGVGSKRAHGARPQDYYGFSSIPSVMAENSNFFANTIVCVYVTSTGVESVLDRFQYRYHERSLLMYF